MIQFYVNAFQELIFVDESCRLLHKNMQESSEYKLVAFVAIGHVLLNGKTFSRKKKRYQFSNKSRKILGNKLNVQ